MGRLEGHVAIGGLFLLIGLWHLYNHIKLQATHKQHYNSPLPWHPSSIHRHLELYLIIFPIIIFSISELRSTHLRNYEHVSMAMSFLLYAISAIALDKLRSINNLNDIVWVVVSLAFAQQLLLFHFHSTDHAGLERQYHLLLELVVLVCLVTSLMGVGFPRSFAVAFTRSLSLTLQGIWLVLMGFMLWTPGLMPEGCSIQQDKNGRDVIACGHNDGSLDRAKALVNIEFTLILIGLTGFALVFYILMVIKYGGFVILNEDEDVKIGPKFVHVESGMTTVDLAE